MDCVFCKIVAGEIPSPRVYEDDVMIVIRDMAPAAPTHLLLIPKVHTPNVTTVAPEVLSHMLSKVKELAAQEGILEKGFRLVMNTGGEGGQSVDHLHIHLIGGKQLGWPPC